MGRLASIRARNNTPVAKKNEKNKKIRKKRLSVQKATGNYMFIELWFSKNSL